jgi:hypothetical protein
MMNALLEPIQSTSSADIGREPAPALDSRRNGGQRKVSFSLGDAGWQGWAYLFPLVSVGGKRLRDGASTDVEVRLAVNRHETLQIACHATLERLS